MPIAAQLRGYGIAAIPTGLSLPSGSWWGSVLVLIPLLTIVWSVVVWVRAGSSASPATDSPVDGPTLPVSDPVASP